MQADQIWAYFQKILVESTAHEFNETLGRLPLPYLTFPAHLQSGFVYRRLTINPPFRTSPFFYLAKKPRFLSAFILMMPI